MVSHVDATAGDDIMLEILVQGILLASMALAVFGHALLFMDWRNAASDRDVMSPAE
jgi:hypothetical protein